jgi:hypothetical protein
MTIQLSEQLEVSGVGYRIRSTPLTLWRETCRPDLNLKSMGSWCWRGYIGTWAIDGGRLYLISIVARYEDGTETTLASLFPGFETAVFAHWFTGLIEASSADTDPVEASKTYIWQILKGKATSSVPEIKTNPIEEDQS